MPELFHQLHTAPASEPLPAETHCYLITAATSRIPGAETSLGARLSQTYLSVSWQLGSSFVLPRIPPAALLNTEASLTFFF